MKYKQYLLIEYWTLEVQAVSRVVLDPKILAVQAESEVSNLGTARMPGSNTI